MNSADEMTKGWISVERAFQVSKFNQVVYENGPVEIDAAAMKPILAYESTDAECPEVFGRSIAEFIRVCTNVVDDMEPKLCRKRP